MQSWPKLTCVYSLAPSFATPSSNKHPPRLHLSPRYGHLTLVSGFLVLTAIIWHEYPMSFIGCESLCDLMFTKFTGLRSPYWCDTVVVGDSTRLRAIPLAMLTMKKETLCFHNFYAWFSSVSLISVGMGLRSWPLKNIDISLFFKFCSCWMWLSSHANEWLLLRRSHHIPKWGIFPVRWRIYSQRTICKNLSCKWIVEWKWHFLSRCVINKFRTIIFISVKC